MKNVRLFSMIVLGVLMLVGCSGDDASDRITASLNDLVTPAMSDFDDGLDYYEAKLDYFENVVEILTTEALEPSADADVILSESEALLERIETETDNFQQYSGENFERHCYEDGGDVVIEDDGAVWCEIDSDSLNQQGRNRVWDRLEELTLQTMAVEYVLFDSVINWDKLLNELESDVDVFEAEIDARLAYAEENETETWDLIQQDNLFWGYWEDLVTDYITMLHQIEAMRIGAEFQSRHQTNRLGIMQNRLNNIVRDVFVTS